MTAIGADVKSSGVCKLLIYKENKKNLIFL